MERGNESAHQPIQIFDLIGEYGNPGSFDKGEPTVDEFDELFPRNMRAGKDKSASAAVARANHWNHTKAAGDGYMQECDLSLVTFTG